MYKRIFSVLLVCVFTVFIAVACSSKDDGNQAKNNNEESSQNEDVENTDSNQADETDDAQNSNDVQNADDTANADSNDSTSDNDKDLPKTIEINDKQQTDTGLVFELEEIAFEDDHIAVSFNAENQSGLKKTLASKGAAKNSNLGGITLQDDTGFDYRYVADTGDSRIVVDDQEKVDGIVRFAGKIQPDAKTLTLKFNPESEDDASSTPKFSYEDIEIEW